MELAALREAAEQAQAAAARQHERLLAAETSIASLQVGCPAPSAGAPSSLLASISTMASVSTTPLVLCVVAGCELWTALDSPLTTKASMGFDAVCLCSYRLHVQFTWAGLPA